MAQFPPTTIEDPICRFHLRSFFVSVCSVLFSVAGTPFPEQPKAFAVDRGNPLTYAQNYFATIYEDKISPPGVFDHDLDDALPPTGGPAHWETLRGWGIGTWNGPGTWRDMMRTGHGGVEAFCEMIRDQVIEALANQTARDEMIASGFEVTEDVIEAMRRFNGIIQINIEGHWPQYDELFYDNRGLIGNHCKVYKQCLDRQLGFTTTHAQCKAYFDADYEYFERFLKGVVEEFCPCTRYGRYAYPLGGPNYLWDPYEGNQPGQGIAEAVVKAGHREWLAKGIYTILMPSIYNYYKVMPGEYDLETGQVTLEQFINARQRYAQEVYALKQLFNIPVLAECRGVLDGAAGEWAHTALEENDVMWTCDMLEQMDADYAAWWEVIANGAGEEAIGDAYIVQWNLTFANPANIQRFNDFARTPLKYKAA